jgi:hypothetical protein
VTLVVQALLGGGVLAMSSVNAPRAAVV